MFPVFLFLQRKLSCNFGHIGFNCHHASCCDMILWPHCGDAVMFFASVDRCGTTFHRLYSHMFKVSQPQGAPNASGPMHGNKLYVINMTFVFTKVQYQQSQNIKQNFFLLLLSIEAQWQIFPAGHPIQLVWPCQLAAGSSAALQFFTNSHQDLVITSAWKAVVTVDWRQ